MGYLVVCGLYLPLRSGPLDGTGDISPSYLIFYSALIILILSAMLFEKKLRIFIWLALIGATITTFIGLYPSQTNNKIGTPNTDFFNISKTGQNIFLISFDALQAGYIQKVLDNNEDIKKAFNGFVNFTHVTAVAPFTLQSTLTTKIGNTPETNMDTNTLVKNHSDDFITTHLQQSDHQVSTYGSFNLGESKNTLTIQDRQISPRIIDDYILAFSISFQKYIPYYLKEVISKSSIMLYSINKNFDETTKPSLLYTLTAQDPDPMSNAKTDITDFDFYTAHLKPSIEKNTAHFHHYFFTHRPRTFDKKCNYRTSNTVKQNSTSTLEETECALIKFITFIDKLKALNTFDNSMIIFASDHGHDCPYNAKASPKRYRVSQRWCLSRYEPLLMIKPFNTDSPIYNNPFEASLLDISKTICENTSGDTACKKYVGVDLLNIQPKDTGKTRKIITTKKDAYFNARDYNEFDIIDIGRKQTIWEHFGADNSKAPDLPIISLPRTLRSGIDADTVDDARVAIPGKHKKGILTTGPQLDLPPGKYILQIEYQSAPSWFRRVGHWKIVTNDGKTKIGKGSLPSTNNELNKLSIPFSVDERMHDVEIRVYFGGKHEMRLEKVIVKLNDTE